MRVAVPLAKCHRMINHGPTTIIASARDGRRNVMAATWVMALDDDPPKVAVAIAEGTQRRELVEVRVGRKSPKSGQVMEYRRGVGSLTMGSTSTGTG